MKTFRQEVVEAAIQGLIEGGYPEESAEWMRNLLENMYDSGYKEARREQYISMQTVDNTIDSLSRCPRCGGPADNGHDRQDPPNPYSCTVCVEYEKRNIT